MANDDVRDQIEQLKIRIEELAASAERCRKIILFSKVCMFVGGLLLFAIALAPIRLNPAVLICGIAAIIGGIVVFGSNKSTMEQTMGTMKSTATLRAELISRIDLRIVDADGAAPPDGSYGDGPDRPAQ